MDKREYVIRGFEPKSVFRFFEDISAVPRGSGNEAGIANALVAFARERNLEYFRDGINNVLIRKPATAGFENEKPVLFQGHTDMVCEKNAGTEHDFLKDGIKLIVDGDTLRADGTTLGADDGVAVAFMMAILDGAVTEHPEVECLFTVSEETGLTGAFNFDYSRIKARRMINLDVSGEGCVICGSSGGCRSTVKIPAEYVGAAGHGISVTLSDLKGGHSGEDIHRSRTNANKFMGELLLELRRYYDYNLISFDGGRMTNAIPRECRAVITGADYEALAKKIVETGNRLGKDVSKEDKGFKLRVEHAEIPSKMMSCSCTRKIIDAINLVRDGVIRMSAEISGMTEYSRNLGIVRTTEGCVEMQFLSRSPSEERLDRSEDYIDAFAELCGASAEHSSRYPGWEFEAKSPLREKYMKAAREVLGIEPVIELIHGGLECGVIKHFVPDMQIIAIGPDAAHFHSPDECLSLGSCERLWKIVEKMLAKETF